MNKSKMMLGAAMLAAGTLFGANALAADCVTPTSYSALNTLGATGCLSEDKTWANFSTDAITNTFPDSDASLTTTTVGIDDYHRLTWNGVGSGGFGAGVYVVDYSIVVTPLSSGLLITSLNMGITVTVGTGSSRLEVFDYTGGIKAAVALADATVTGTTLQPLITIFGASATQAYWVTQTITVDAGSLVDNVSSTFLEAGAAPEPTTLALFGMGFSALALRARRRKG